MSAMGDNRMGFALLSVLGTGVLAGALAGGEARAQSSAVPAPSGVYTCVDAQGRKLTSDRPIAACADREQKVLNPSGTVRARVGPTLTAQERAEQEARQKAQAEAQALVQEEKRRERALLMRYPSRLVHDRERSEALKKVSVVVQAASRRIDELLVDRRKLDEEMEFYKKDPSRAPASVRRQIEDIETSVAVQKRFIGEQDNEVRRINARFDDELERLLPLWAARAGAKPDLANAKKAP